ncbi:MAG: hypothetical protein HW421_2565 [Ignavibacteria bacterium]|nr:hypothetical protein [Ignavibacteria bacterium]
MYKLILLIFLSLPIITKAQPGSWEARGIGGGGALFSPSICPDNEDEIYIGCDMSELFHTIDFGLSWDAIHFSKIFGGHNSTVCFTNQISLLYCLNYQSESPFPVKSTNRGLTWTKLASNPAEGEILYSIFVDYDNPQRIIISSYSDIFYSSNGGTSFASIHKATDNGSGIVIGGAFFDGNNIFLGTNDGLIVSTNGGANFAISNVTGITAGQKIWSFAGAKQGNIVRFFCITGNSVYAGMQGSDYWNFIKGVYSLDWGSGNWLAKSTGIDFSKDFLMFVGMATNDINTIYLCGSSSSAYPNVMKSTNAGTNWSHVFNTTMNQNISTGWSGDGGDRFWSYGECAFGFAVAPRNAQKLIFTDFGFAHVSFDGSTSWKQAYVSNTDQNPPGSKTPTGKSYHSIGLENTTCWQVTWSDKDNLFACFSDIKGVRSTDGGNSWSFNYTGHSANTMYRIARNPQNGWLYAGTSNIHDMYQSTRLKDNILDANDANGKIIYSTNKGAVWSDIHNFGHPVFWVALDPNNPNKMYASVVHSASGGIYVTNNLQNGPNSTWSKLANPPRTEGHPASIVVLNDGNIVVTYSGRIVSNKFTASSGVFIYNPSNDSWTDVSDNGMKYWTKDIIVDPFDQSQNTWYVGVFSGWGGAPNGLGGLYKTTNRGVSWKRINNLDRVTSITFHPENHDDVYLTTEVDGLWHSSAFNADNPSFSLVESYPFKQPERVYYNPFDKDEVWVSSFGNGMRVGTNKVINPPLPPKLISPNNGKTGVPTSGTLVWSKSANATNYNVRLWMDYTGEIIIDSTINDTLITFNNLYKNTRFLWKVIPIGKAVVGNSSDIWSFHTIPDSSQIIKIKLISPPNRSVNLSTNIDLEWEPVTGASLYTYKYTDDTTLDVSKWYWGFIFDVHEVRISKLKNNTKYYWKIESGTDYKSDLWTFSTRPINPNYTSPELITPDSNSSGVFKSINFKWKSVPTAKKYQFQLSQDSLFSYFEVDSVIKNDTTFFWHCNEYLINYYWRVQVFDSISEGLWSNIWNFKTDKDTLLYVEPELLAPANGAKNVQQPFTLRWISVEVDEIIYYRIIIFDIENGKDSIIYKNTTFDTSLEIKNLNMKLNQTYYWYIYSEYLMAMSKPSATWSFTTSLEAGYEDVPRQEKCIDLNVSPNPASHQITIEMISNYSSFAQLNLYDILGRKIYDLFHGNISPGKHEITFDLIQNPINQGVYFLQYSRDDCILTKRIYINY